MNTLPGPPGSLRAPYPDTGRYLTNTRVFPTDGLRLLDSGIRIISPLKILKNVQVTASETCRVISFFLQSLLFHRKEIY